MMRFFNASEEICHPPRQLVAVFPILLSLSENSLLTCPIRIRIEVGHWGPFAALVLRLCFCGSGSAFPQRFFEAGP